MGILRIEIPRFVISQGEKKNLRAALRQAGQDVAKTARALVRNAGGSGAYHNGHYASAVGEPPASLSGELARSITARTWSRGGELGVTVKDSVYYAKFLETGAEGGGPGSHNTKANPKRKTRKVVRGKRVLEPRPFISRALDAKRSDIDERLKVAVLADIEFKKE